MAAPPEQNPPGATGGLGILFHDRNDLLNTASTAAAQAVILGIDIGASGAIALLTPTGELVDVFDMPCLADGPGAGAPSTRETGPIRKFDNIRLSHRPSIGKPIQRPSGLRGGSAARWSSIVLRLTSNGALIARRHWRV